MSLLDELMREKEDKHKIPTTNIQQIKGYTILCPEITDEMIKLQMEAEHLDQCLIHLMVSS